MVTPNAIEIHPGEHPTGHLFGMTFNLDTIWVTVIAGAIVVALGFWARAKLTAPTADRVPTKIQLVWETLVKAVSDQVEDSLGEVNPFVVPLAVALFFFILIANWMEVIPTALNEHKGAHLLPSPTADTNLTYALAILVMIGVWSFGVRKQGLGGYLKHFIGVSLVSNPVADVFVRAFFTFLNVIEEITKPVTLALRLFGNIFAGGIMIALIGGLVDLAPLHIPVGAVVATVLNVVWKLFDTMFLGGVQAFIFALLTVLYFGMAATGHGDDHDEANERDPARDDDHRPADAVEVDTEHDEVRKPEPATAH